MLTPFPESGRVAVSPALAGELLNAAESLPPYDNREFYSPAVQEVVFETVRGACPDGFDGLVGEVRRRLARRPYCALVGGLSFDEGNRLFVALNRAFGELVALPYQPPRAQLVHYVEPSTDIESGRGGPESERLHTDTTDWERPVEIVSMLCVRADAAGGGRSRVLDVDAVREEVGGRLGGATLRLLESEPLPWRLAAPRGGGVVWRTVLTEKGMCWRRLTIDLALDGEEVGVPAGVLASLDAFEQIIGGSGLTIDFLLREGEFLLMDNTRTVHARTPVAGDGRRPGRLMLRSWVRTS
jgi:Taurine catabolism dioxygenase TauD, TfdA family